MTAPGARLPDVSTLFPVRSWFGDPTLRSWTTWLFVALVAVPPLAIVLSRGAEDADGAATTFAFYFAAAWFLVLWVLVRPQQLRGGVLAQVVAVALAVEFPLAFGLETVLDAGTGNVFTSIVTVGVPEEFAKMVPVVAIVLWQGRSGRRLPARDVLFLGAVSGLVFGAVEAVEYVTTLPAIGTDDALTVAWRLLTDPVSHACWAGVAGYFVGLASYYREPGPWFALAGLGLGVPAILHGIDDVVAGTALWVVVAVVSTLLFLAYARIGITGTTTTAPSRHRASAVSDPITEPIALGFRSS